MLSIYKDIMYSLFLPYLRLSVSPVANNNVALTDGSNHSTVFACQVQNVTDTRLIGWGGGGVGKGGERGKILNRKQNPPCMTTLPPSSTSSCHLQSPPASAPSLPLFHPFPSSFHSCHSSPPPTKSVLIANHHKPAK